MANAPYIFRKFDCTVTQARYHFDYNPVTGVLKPSPRHFGFNSMKRPKSDCIRRCGEYPAVTWLGETVMLHRFVWFMYYGEWSEYIIDHIDHDKENYKIENLREVLQSHNVQNTRRKVGPSGYQGVTRCGRKFVAKISHSGGERVLIGKYDTAEEASAAYQEAKLKYHVAPDVHPMGRRLPYDMLWLFEDWSGKFSPHMQIKTLTMQHGYAPLSRDPDVLRWTPF